MSKGRVVMGLLFFPRGGSAQVARYLAPALGAAGWSVSLVSGSLGQPGEGTHAPTFFGEIGLQHLDYTDAVQAFEVGGSAVAAPVPMHPSYEDRADAPDVVLAAVHPTLLDHLSSAWDGAFGAAGAADADVFHLHHLTPQFDSVSSNWPDTPVVAHLHGTELKFIEAAERRLRGDDGGITESWRHSAFWVDHLRIQASKADHLIVVSPPDRQTAIDVLHVAPERVSAVPNGVDVDLFAPQHLRPGARRALFRRWLVDEPRGWDVSGRPGSVAYSDSHLDRLLGPDGDATLLVFVGRFTSAKRVPVLVRAWARARERFERPGSLLIWGGHPGEWEDEHPVPVARELGDDGIYFSGWRGHEELPQGLAACDVLVMPSVNDSYPQTPLEAMAAGLPVLATRSGGFPSIVDTGSARPTGWLVPPDDIDALADAIVHVVNRPDDVARRGANALDHARADLSWAGLVPRFEETYALAEEWHARRN